MQVALELYGSASSRKAWLRDRQALIDSLERLRVSRPVSLILDDHDVPPTFNAEKEAARLLGYDSYRDPVAGERLVAVGAVDPESLAADDGLRFSCGSVQDAAVLDHVWPSLVRDADGHPVLLAKVAAEDARAHSSLSILLKVLYVEQLTPDVVSKPSVESVALMIVEYGTKVLRLRRPRLHELFVTAIATKLSPTELASPRVAEVEQAVAVAEERWKKRRQVAERHLKSLMKGPIVIHP